VIDGNGNIVATSEIIGGRHNDSYELKGTIGKLFADLKRNHLEYRDAFFNADGGFDTREARKMLWNRRVRPNIPENKRNRKRAKRGRKRHFNREVYKKRFVIERTFAWIDKFRTLVTRYERKDAYWLGFHLIAFTLINLRSII
jgi:transposase